MGRAKEALQAYADGWNSADADAIIALFDEHAVVVDPVGTPAHEGIEAIRTFFDRAMSMPITITLNVHRIVDCGDEGALVFTIESRSDSGGGIDIDVVDIFQVNEEGKITQMKAYWNKTTQRAVSGS